VKKFTSLGKWANHKEEAMAPMITRSEASNKPTRTYPSSPFRLFEDFFNDWAIRSLEGRSAETWTPPVDVLERDGNLVLMVSLPGMSDEDVELKIEGQILTVRGERKSQESDGYRYHQMESFCGNFSRSFTLPDSTDLQNIKADYKNGMLVIAVPQKPEVRPRNIKINT
jgi:HSP20 family protein